MRVYHGNIVHSQGAALATWRSAVAIAGKNAGCIPLPGSVRLDLLFGMPKPRTVKRTFPSVAPDLDKLIRGVLDALTAIAYLDDGQVIDINAAKVYALTPFCEINVIYQSE
jgi:crossover junction endodeoxyribonuclease RusA